MPVNEYQSVEQNASYDTVDGTDTPQLTSAADNPNKVKVLNPDENTLDQSDTELEEDVRKIAAENDFKQAQIEGENQENLHGRPLVLWYPHVEVHNRNQINLSQDLERYGAYHFEIYFSPKVNHSIDAVNNAMKQNQTEFAGKQTEIMDKLEKVKSDNGGSAGFTANVGSVGSYLWNIGTNLIANGIAVAESALPSSDLQVAQQAKTKSSPDLVASTPVYKFDKQSLRKADIYLPLTKYNVHRSSGIEEQEDVVSSLGAALAKTAYQVVTDFTGQLTSTAIRGAAGAEIRNFVAPRTKSPSLDKFQLEWDLFARNRLEKLHIKNILRFFNSASVPLFNKNDFFYTMPPVMFMEINTANFSDSVPGTIKHLRPKRQYFLTDITITTNPDNDGSTLLDRDGEPVYVNLKIDLIKVDITTGTELFVYPYM